MTFEGAGLSIAAAEIRMESKAMERSTETRASSAGSVSASCSTVRVSDSGDWQATLEENISAADVVSFSAFNPWRWYLAFRHAKVITIEPVVFLYMLAVYLNSSLTSQYYDWRFGKLALMNTSFPSAQNLSFCINSSELDLYGGNGTADSVKTSSRHLLIFTGLAHVLPSVFTALLLGPFSDHYGRRFIIYFVTAGAILQGLMSIAVIHFELDIYFFILTSAVSGITGGYASILTATMAYIADISSQRWRTFRIGLVESMVFFSGAVGQGISGYWLAELNCSYTPPLWLFTACNAVVILYTLIFLPESITYKERKRMAGRTSCCKNLVQGLRMYLCGLKYSTWRLWAALIAMSAVVANLTGSQAISPLFFQASPLEWNPGEIGAYKAVNMATHGVVLVLLLPVFVGIKFPDALIAIVGLTFIAGVNIFTGFVSQLWQMFVVCALSSVESVTIPSVRGILSKLVAAQDQGALFSVVASAEVLAAAVAMIVYPYIYPLTLKDVLKSGTLYILLAILCIIPASLLLLLLFCRKYQRDPNTADNSSSDLESRIGHSERDSLMGDLSCSSDAYGAILGRNINS